MTFQHAKHILLVATVGGSPEPIFASIQHWNPKRFVFVSSKDTSCKVEEIERSLAEKDYELDPAI